jgi:hypothetical protein
MINYIRNNERKFCDFEPFEWNPLRQIHAIFVVKPQHDYAVVARFVTAAPFANFLTEGGTVPIVIQ